MQYFLVRFKFQVGEKGDGTPKFKSDQMLVQATGITEAEMESIKDLSEMGMDYEVLSVSQSKITKVILNAGN